MENNPLKQLGELGQSIWLDYIGRNLIVSGELQRLIEEDGLRGMTSNPSIFEKAIVESNDYDKDIRIMALKGKDVKTIYETISQYDVQSAADEFKSLYNRTNSRDGCVSLEVNPHLAHNKKVQLVVQQVCLHENHVIHTDEERMIAEMTCDVLSLVKGK